MAEPNIMQGTRFAEHGDRSELQAMAQQGGVPLGVANAPGPSLPSAAPAPGSVGLTNPIARSMSAPGGQDPITSGLTVGPGSTPPMNADPAQAERLSRMEKLSALALYAESPTLRSQAASALRTLLAQGPARKGF